MFCAKKTFYIFMLGIMFSAQAKGLVNYKPSQLNCAGEALPVFIVEPTKNCLNKDWSTNSCIYQASLSVDLKQLCLFDTTTSDSPRLYLSRPNLNEIIIAQFKMSLKNLRLAEAERFNFYTNEHNRLDCSNQVPAVDGAFFFNLAYQQQMPFWFQVKCLHELTHLIDYLRQNLRPDSLQQQQQKPMLLISLFGCGGSLNCIKSSNSRFSMSLTSEDESFLSQHFNLILNDKLSLKMVQNCLLINQLMQKHKLLPFGIKKNVGLMTKTLRWIFQNIKIKDVLLALILLNSFLLFYNLKKELAGVKMPAS